MGHYLHFCVPFSFYLTVQQSSDIHLGGMRGDSHPNNTPSEDSISKKNIQFLRGISDTFGGGMAGIGLIFIGVFVLFLNEVSS